MQLINKDNGQAVNPSLILQKLLKSSYANLELLLSNDNTLRKAVSAQTAYYRMQFELLDDAERDELAKTLQRSCELDTFSMVLIYKAWKEMVRKGSMHLKKNLEQRLAC